MQNNIGDVQKKNSFIASQIFEKDLIYICLPINTNISRLIMSQFLYKHSRGSFLHIFLNSPEYSQKNELFNEIHLLNFILSLNLEFSTHNLGLCCGDLNLLLACGGRNNRFMLKNSKSIFNNVYNKHSMYEIYQIFFKKYWKEYIINYNKTVLYYTQFTNLTYENVTDISSRKLYFKAGECKQFGIIDQIL